MQATTTLAHDLGLRVTAEGVETAKQAAWLRGLGVDRAQGYYFVPPLTSAAVAALLAHGAQLPEKSGGANGDGTDGTPTTTAGKPAASGHRRRNVRTAGGAEPRG